MARRVQGAADPNSGNIKPEPPADLWKQLEEVQKQTGCYMPPKPDANAFTMAEFKERFQLTDAQARSRIRALIGFNKVKQVGRYGSQVYYILCSGQS